MENNTKTNKDMLFDVLFFWDNTQHNIEYKQYCSETLCNILNFTPGLSVKLVYEAEEKGKVLIMSTKNIDKAVDLRDKLVALDMSCKICPTEL